MSGGIGSLFSGGSSGGIGGAIGGMLGLQNAPSSPDYLGAANATAQGNIDAAKYATQANRIDQYTPYGNLTYSYKPQYDANGKETGGGWSQSVDLSQTGQSLLDMNNQSMLSLGGLQNAATQRVADSFSNPFDYQSVKDVEDASYKQQLARLDPQWAANSESMDAKLANQGIGYGTQAYQNAMRSFNEGKNDAYGQARLNAMQMAPQTMQMATSIRNQPLNELNAIRTGSQVSNPTFQNYNQQATTAGADVLGATGQQYNAQLAGVNANNANIMGMLKAGASAMSGGM